MAKILVVDDDQDIRLALSIFLESEGHECVLAEDGEDGFRKLSECSPDVILLDYMMPRLDGAGFCDLLGIQGVRVPVILMSADREIVRKAYQIKAPNLKRVIKKPFDLDELNRLVEAV